MLKALKQARVAVGYGAAWVNLSNDFRSLNVEVLCRELDWQVLSLQQVCTLCLPPISTLEGLYIYEARPLRPEWLGDIENALWLDLLRPFAVAKNLYLSEEFAAHIVAALQDLGRGRTTEVLPTLQNIFLEELEPSKLVQEAIGQFVAARQVTSHPIAVSRWDNSEVGRIPELVEY
jgi:hypothetical protein